LGAWHFVEHLVGSGGNVDYGHWRDGAVNNKRTLQSFLNTEKSVGICTPSKHISS